MRDRLVNASQILMLVRILFFGVLKDLAGQGGESLDLPENSTLGDVLSHYEARIPRLKEMFKEIPEKGRGFKYRTGLPDDHFFPGKWPQSQS